jgi:hypothetical protein
MGLTWGPGTAHILGCAGPGPQLGWVVPDMGRAKIYVLWACLLGTAQMYTYISILVVVVAPQHVVWQEPNVPALARARVW